MTLIAEMRSWRSQAFCIGVSPDGAQVRLRTGWSMKPLSSTKTMLRPSRRAFFYMRPALSTPALDGFVVALASAALGLLAAPAQARQEPPHMTGVIPYAKLLLDHFGHAFQRPELRGVSGGRRTALKQCQQSPAL